jgi:hypothetical protein
MRMQGSFDIARARQRANEIKVARFKAPKAKGENRARR